MQSFFLSGDKPELALEFQLKNEMLCIFFYTLDMSLIAGGFATYFSQNELPFTQKIMVSNSPFVHILYDMEKFYYML